MKFNFFKKEENNKADFSNDREMWVHILDKIARPVLENIANETLKKNMPVEYVKKERAKFAHLEAVGRLICGIGPWLELGPDNSSEGQLRKEFIDLAVKGLVNIANPNSKDYLIFDEPYQPLVDSAHLAEGLIRSKTQIWNRIEHEGQLMILDALKKTRSIEPWVNNWILFPSMIEAFILDITGECDWDRLFHGINVYRDQWYSGDGHYGDGPQFHMDYYNSYVIHPMLTDTLMIMRKHNIEGHEFLDTHLKRQSHYAEQLERMISPEGTYPVVGRSMLYRTAVFQALSQAALLEILPENLKPEQVRSGLSEVFKNQFLSSANFDRNGWLRFGFNGKQKKIAEDYSNTGSLYICTTGFLALGLNKNNRFWKGPFTEWTNLKAWNGKEVDSDMYIRD